MCAHPYISVAFEIVIDHELSQLLPIDQDDLRLLDGLDIIFGIFGEL
jgi:hypothetical protein